MGVRQRPCCWFPSSERLVHSRDEIPRNDHEPRKDQRVPISVEHGIRRDPDQPYDNQAQTYDSGNLVAQEIPADDQQQWDRHGTGAARQECQCRIHHHLLSNVSVENCLTERILLPPPVKIKLLADEGLL